MRSILALDLATNTGWCIAPPTAEAPRFGTLTLPSTGKDIGLFLKKYDEWLNAMLCADDVGLIVFEAPILPRGATNPSTARKLMGLASHTEFVANNRSVMCVEANLMTVKKFFTGHGHADKSSMIATAEANGWAVRNDNEADACAVWAFAVNQRASQFGRQFKRIGGMI